MVNNPHHLATILEPDPKTPLSTTHRREGGVRGGDRDLVPDPVHLTADAGALALQEGAEGEVVPYPGDRGPPQNRPNMVDPDAVAAIVQRVCQEMNQQPSYQNPRDSRDNYRY